MVGVRGFEPPTPRPERGALPGCATLRHPRERGRRVYSGAPAGAQAPDAQIGGATGRRLGRHPTRSPSLFSRRRRAQPLFTLAGPSRRCLVRSITRKRGGAPAFPGFAPAATGSVLAAHRAEGEPMHPSLKAAAAAAAFVCLTAAARADDLTVALICGRTGPLEAYAKQTEIGLRLGFEYATKGSMKLTGARSTSSSRTTRASPIWPRPRSPKPTRTTTPTSPSAPPPRRRRSPCCRSPRSTRRS